MILASVLGDIAIGLLLGTAALGWGIAKAVVALDTDDPHKSLWDQFWSFDHFPRVGGGDTPLFFLAIMFQIVAIAVWTILLIVEVVAFFIAVPLLFAIQIGGWWLERKSAKD